MSQELDKTFDTAPGERSRLTDWWKQRPLSDSERAERTESFFWWRLLAILGAAAVVGTLGILQVRRSTSGIRTAYELVKTNDALREQIEANRHAEATLTGLKNPNELRKEGTEVFRMRVPGADEQVQVDEAAGTD